MCNTMLNPMCCLSPRIGAIAFGILDLILSTPLAYDAIRVLANNNFDWNRLLDSILCIVLFILALILLFGAIQKSAENIRMWLGAWTVFMVLWAILYVFQVSTETNVVSWVTGLGLGMVLLFIYQLWVVYAFYIELGRGSMGLTYWPAKMGPTVIA